jgi:hypothetical protein
VHFADARGLTGHQCCRDDDRQRHGRNSELSWWHGHLNGRRVTPICDVVMW